MCKFRVGWLSLLCTVGSSFLCPQNLLADHSDLTSLVSLTVVSGADKVRDTDWATIKGSGDVIVEVTLDPNTDAAAADITWSGGSAVPDHPRQRKVSKSSSDHTTVDVSLTDVTGASLDLDVWVIWSTIDIKMGAGDSIDSKCITTGSNPTGSWRGDLGGGTSLGPISHNVTPGFTYAYAGGKMQATATLTPSGVENVVSKTAWGWVRTMEAKSYDNGTLSSSSPAGTSDGPSTANSMLDPTTSSGKLFNLDLPACPFTTAGWAVNHTAELYINFAQYATVSLGTAGAKPCSDSTAWYVRQKVDIDLLSVTPPLAPGDPIVQNVIATGSPGLPSGSAFTPPR